ncbi:MAG: hypothetical protein AB7O88_25895 [Reyranellaceae bacterium]
MAYSEAGYESDFSSAESTSATGSETSGSPDTSDSGPERVAESAAPSGQADDGPRTGIWHDDSSSRTLYTSDSDIADPYERNRPTAHQGPFWALRRFFRRLFGQPDDAPDDAPAGGAEAAQLVALAREGFDLHPHYGNQSVAHVAERMGFTDLGGKMAYEQLAYMRENWGTIDAREAQARANAGGLVVAGSGGPAQAQTAVVTPGPGVTGPDGGFYPNVTCGGLGNARSDGSRTVADVWPVNERAAVEYFEPL